jgi:uncharacterized protein YbaP (TraB family)
MKKSKMNKKESKDKSKAKPKSKQKMAEKKEKYTLLWRIEHEGIKSPCYLFGTMHVRDARAFVGVEQIKQYIAQCESFASEFDLNEADRELYSSSLVLGEGRQLADLFKAQEYKKLAKVFKRETGQELKYFSYLKPIAISNILAEAQFSREENDSLDDTLYQFAQTQSKKILGLETFDEQLAILANISEESQLKSLRMAATNFERVRRQIQKSVDAYCSANLLKVYKTVKKANSSQHKLLLKERNKIMAERIWAAAADSSIFVAVGAAHLGGKIGLLQEMRVRGAKLSPIRY